MVLGLGGEYTKLSGFNTAYTYPSAATPSLSRISAQREFFNVAPEAALRWQPAAAWTLHARVSGGYGTPQIGNLFVAADGNPGKHPELDSPRNYAVDVGAAWHLAQHLRVAATGLYELLRADTV